MQRTHRALIVLFAALSLVGGGSYALAQGKDKDKDHQGQGQGKSKEHKQHKHHDGKSLLGDKVKTNGHHVFHQNGKFTAAADVTNGKIAGLKVKHADKGDVPVKKYKTTKKMAELPSSGFLPLMPLGGIFGTETAGPEKGSAVVLEADGRRVALLVDALLGQEQVVIKTLEANYRKVPCVAGATILGEGRVVLILDAAALVRAATEASAAELIGERT